jgi:D-alanine--poly(phosphoribitol) ligase subunit 1
MTMHQSLDGLFSRSVLSHPTRAALVVHGRPWSYIELDSQCRQIEAALQAAGVAGKRAKVGLLYGRSTFTYAAIIAIMRSRNVYVPLNPKLPAERLLRIIEDAQIEVMILDATDEIPGAVVTALRRADSLKLVIPQGAHGESLMSTPLEAHEHVVFQVGEYDSEENGGGTTSRADAVTPADVAYIIYTSGSTGVPKGVTITHHSACSCIEKSYRSFETTAGDRFTQFSALSFDVSILDLFLCWKSGAALCVPEEWEVLAPLKFAISQGITVWSSVPSLANIMLKLGLLRSNALQGVRLALFCGEALPGELAHAFLTAAPGCRVFNLYGPTECTIFATYHEYDLQRDRSYGTVPIGSPLSGLRCMLVDEGRVVNGTEAAGELWISGDQLALGYWNNPTATQAAFVRFPASDATADLWYRTGDLASRDGEGGLEFRGRLDRQVKLRGHRIELQEIESALRDVIGCTLVAVVPMRDPGGICNEIVAYCDSMKADEAAIKASCLDKIPRYMVPDRIMKLDVFPFSDHGKVDYRELTRRAAARIQ